MKKVLTIAGSDSGGGAGIEADLKTMFANGVYGMTAITAVTAQNTMEVKDIFEIPDDVFENELRADITDIFPDAVKIGMVYSANKVRIIADIIEDYKLENIVLDPIIFSTSGRRLLSEEAFYEMADLLFPEVALITPNIPEADYFISDDCLIDSEEEMIDGAKFISHKYGANVLLKGGHMTSNPVDVLCEVNNGISVFHGERIDNKDTHGTGCVLSSAIASNLAKGYSLKDSVAIGREFLNGAIKANFHIGHGHGPMDLGYDIKSKYKDENI